MRGQAAPVLSYAGPRPSITIVLGISWYIGNRSCSCLEKMVCPSTITSKMPRSPRSSWNAWPLSPNLALSSATRPVAWGR